MGRVDATTSLNGTIEPIVGRVSNRTLANGALIIAGVNAGEQTVRERKKLQRMAS